MMASSDTARLHTRGLFSGRLSMKGGPCNEKTQLLAEGGLSGLGQVGVGRHTGPHLVVDGEGGHLHGHSHDVHSAIDQARLKLLVQVYKLLLPVGVPGCQYPSAQTPTVASRCLLFLEPHLLLRAACLGFTVQVDQAQEVDRELQHHGKDGVQVEDVG